MSVIEGSERTAGQSWDLTSLVQLTLDLPLTVCGCIPNPIECGKPNTHTIPETKRFNLT